MENLKKNIEINFLDKIGALSFLIFYSKAQSQLIALPKSSEFLGPYYAENQEKIAMVVSALNCKCSENEVKVFGIVYCPSDDKFCKDLEPIIKHFCEEIQKDFKKQKKDNPVELRKNLQEAYELYNEDKRLFPEYAQVSEICLHLIKVLELINCDQEIKNHAAVQWLHSYNHYSATAEEGGSDPGPGVTNKNEVYKMR